MEPAFQALRIVRSWEHRVEAPPDAVFPLLCPVREYEWIPGWRCELIHLPAGHAEYGGVFVTEFPEYGRGVWMVSRYEPPAGIAYTVFYRDRYIELLEVHLRADGQTAAWLTWTLTYTGLGDEGNRFLAETTGRPLDERMRRQLKLLEDSCAAGLGEKGVR